ncbi:unnamed protein product, partial [marine sediment metagenome]
IMNQQTVIKAAVRNEKGKGSVRKLRSKKNHTRLYYMGIKLTR